MIAIIDYDAGNLISVKRALDYLQIPSTITSDSGGIASATHIIFPGVGHATAAMNVLTARGLDKTLQSEFAKGKPILGICLGTQIILSHSQEGDTRCLGLIEGHCPRFKLEEPDLKIPHMGWNSVERIKEHPVFDGISPQSEFYFVHSYYPKPDDSTKIFGLCNYKIDFPAIVGENNLIATQFHPEKSGVVGLKVLENFSKWDGSLC